MQGSALPSSIAGFTPIPVSYSSTAIHLLYARTHVGSKKSKSNAKGKQVDFPEGRTLFLVNVPPDATEREITLLFKSSGTVERVAFDREADLDQVPEAETDSEDEDGNADAGSAESDVEEAPRPRKKRKTVKDAAPQVVSLPIRPARAFHKTGHSAHVVFLDPSSLARALTPPAKPRSWPTDADADAPRGLAHYIALHDALRPPLDVVRAHADSWMERFDHERARALQQSKFHKGEPIVDSDGFTLVKRGGAYGKALGGEVGVASKKFQAGGHSTSGGKRNRKGKEKKEKDGFYTFQIHEKNRKELIDLQSKWEEDKAKVEKLKQSRKFKPY